MPVFRQARAAAASWNLAKTLAQTTVFWLVFLVLCPWAITMLEARLGVPALSFPGQALAAGVLFVASTALNLGSGAYMATVGEGTPLPLDCARRLVVRGPYRYVRNPMAIGGLGLGAAVGIWFGSMSVLAYVIAGGLIWNVFVRPVEEGDLQQRFGSEFDAYRSAIGCWLPRLRGYQP